MKEETGHRRPCCRTGCDDCPYNYGEKMDPHYPAELQDTWNDEDKYRAVAQG